MTPVWRKSSRSGTSGNESTCVEVANLTGTTLGTRDSKNPDAGHLTLTRSTFAHLITSVKTGTLDLP
ncbi:DUF397 domain-containing protein [Actinomadura flavalba]|uniref:DUF397 domain-containing protein n=1 Tax=Actinomadura flavalba TaxID=1120938 RepID=UPI00036937CC|nr:DUF397 domain-containing protein [Actinomadura flavalba]